ncbi:hypothetical protein OEZ85_014250 [Tetradesmus obliquus]|uniref:Uncharacterized protein n=1 Tax=Tetradesmus obliquus TaxID=3088 RepID=A0ABY8U7G7_TETOB|nr:hypothetical protein OEZ85_014250 [Tetradesmus obliquus]
MDDDCWFVLSLRLARLKDLRIKATDASGAQLDQATICVPYCPGKKAIGSISSFLRQLTCLDLPDVRLHELGAELKALGSLKSLRMLGLWEENSGKPGSAAQHAATRKELGLPGPLGVEDAQQWLTRPDEGW